MEKIYKSRIVSLSKALIVFFILGVIVFIHRLQTDELDVQLQALEKLQNINRQDLNSIPNPDSLFRLWLQKKDKDLYDRHILIRKQLTKFIEENGFAGFIVQKSSNAEIFQLSDLVLYNMPFNQRQLSSTSSINYYLAKVKGYTSEPVKFYFVTSIDMNALHKGLDSTISVLKARGNTGAENNKVDMIQLDENILNFNISTREYGQKQGENFDLPVQVDSVILPSVKELNGNRAVLLSNDDIETVMKVGRFYNDMSVTTIIDIISKEYAEAYQAVSLLGFTFSTSLFHYFMIFFCLVISVALFFNSKEANTLGVKIYGDQFLEDVFEPCVNNNLLRIITWLIIPLASIYFSLPPFESLTWDSLIPICIAVLLILIINFCSLRLANKNL